MAWTYMSDNRTWSLLFTDVVAAYRSSRMNSEVCRFILCSDSDECCKTDIHIHIID